MENETAPAPIAPIEEVLVPSITDPVMVDPAPAPDSSIQNTPEPELATPEQPTREPSLLSELSTDGAEANTADQNPSESSEQDPNVPDREKEAGKEELTPPVATEPVKYEDFSVPEGVTVDKEQMAEYTKLIGEHRLPQETAQKLIDMHVDAVKEISEKVSRAQWDVFNEQQRAGRNEIMSDPELGGAGHQTAMQKIAYVLNKAAPGEQRAQLNEVLHLTGAGNNLVIAKAFYNLWSYLQPAKFPEVQVNPVQDRGPKPTSKMDLLYNHPTSKRM